jgi:hypothetical protein
MIGLAAGTQIWIVAGVTDMRRGFVELSRTVQTALAENPFSGQVFVFRGKRGDLIKLLWSINPRADAPREIEIYPFANRKLVSRQPSDQPVLQMTIGQQPRRNKIRTASLAANGVR